MSHHINLYDPSLRRQRRWLTAANLALALALLAADCWLGRVGTSRRRSSGDRTGPAEARLGRARGVGGTGGPAGQSQARRATGLDLAAARELLDIRQGILDKLGEGAAPAAGKHAEHLRGLARQSLSGLWLTGFAVGADGRRMEIRGRTLDPALLPQYVRRLNAEAAGTSLRPAQPEHARRRTRLAVPAFHEFALGPEDDAASPGAAP
jgi:hypothetical protein